MEPSPSYDHVWCWAGNWWRPVYRFNDRCRVLVRSSKLNSILVEFQDGFKVVTSAWAVRPVTQGEKEQMSFFGGNE